MCSMIASPLKDSRTIITTDVKLTSFFYGIPLLPFPFGWVLYDRLLSHPVAFQNPGICKQYLQEPA